MSDHSALLGLVKKAQNGEGETICGLEVYHEVMDGRVWVGLAGTDSIPDALRSLHCWGVKWPGQSPGWVHAGYNRAGNELFRLGHELVKGKEAHIAGHSLGASAARKLCRYLQEAGITVAELVPFGEPPGGSPGFVANDSLNSTRYVCGRDPITKLFPWWSHSGDPVNIPTQHGRLNPLGGLFDHKLSSYERALK